MEITIKSIQNKELRKAAEYADSNLNGQVDEQELSLFTSRAIKNDCATSQILSAIEPFKSCTNDHVQSNFAKLEEIKSLETELAKKKEQLSVNQTKLEQMPKAKTVNNSACVGMGIGGLGGLTYAGYAVMSATGPVGLAIAAGMGLLTAVGATLIGMKAGENIGEKIESHDEKIARNNREVFEKENITKLVGEIDRLERAIEKAYEEFSK